MKKLILLCSTAVVMPTAAFAQSTGSQDFEEEAIIVTGSRTQEVGGVQAPDTPKAKAVLTKEIIARQNPGQTILDTVNLVPGVSFQNNDAYGSSGGTLTIRGFDSSRISLTFDGIPLNDSGNYAIFSNQQLDPELIEQVNVNLGTTDVDSPTASAVGGTVNYNTINPSTRLGGRVVGSLGEDDFRRIFAIFHTGEFTPWGTRAWVAVSTAKNDHPFNNFGQIDKKQYNAKIYQPIGAGGDFVTIRGHYNQNRNNSNAGLPLRLDRTQSPTDSRPRTVGTNPTQRFPDSRDERSFDLNVPCLTDQPQAGVADVPTPATLDLASCGTEFDRRYNPSNTGNLQATSRFTLTDRLALTIDPSFQYVKANGGGTVTAREFGFDINPNPLSSTGGANRANCATTPNSATVNCIPGFFGGSPFAGGVDLNGDGDFLDQVTTVSPSQTRTYRVGVIAGLRFRINDDHTLRGSYTFDHANHRQTGEVGFVDRFGEPRDFFPIDDPIAASNGVNLQKRDRQSYAILHQISGEYIGSFMSDRLQVRAGARLPFFTRKLDNNCFTSSASGFVECSGGNAALDAIIAANNPFVVNPTTGAISGFSPPQERKLKYDDVLPNIGAVFDITQRISVFGNYAKGLSVPSTDNLYNAFFFPPDTDQAKPDPETTDSFDGGLRYRSSKVQAQASVWMTKFNNRTASAFDPELNQTVFRNLGKVDKWGIDGSIAWQPIRPVTLYAFGSWNDSEIKDNIQVGALPAGVTCDTVDRNSVNGLRNCAFTAGNRESGAPKYTYGFSALGTVGDVDVGVTAKRTGPRFIFDNGAAMFRGDIGVTAPTAGRVVQEQIFGATAPAYWLANLDVRYNLRKLVGLEKSYFQLNVYNLFDKLFVGGFGGGLVQATSTRTCNATSTPSCAVSTTVPTYGNPPFVAIGAPRTISGTLSIEF